MDGATGVRRERSVGVDVLRGVAVLLMVLDHALVLVDSDNVLRVTATRWSLPLFVGCSAWAFRGRLRWPRVRVLLVLVVVEQLLNGYLGLGRPGPVVLIFGLLYLRSQAWWKGWEPVVAAGGLLQALYLPMGWSGYEPGLVVLWGFVGVAVVEALRGPAERLPGWLARVGRRPALWYGAHLAVLSVVVAVM